jgi:glycosyltransferase involved in cell wall biosynthesis
MSSPVVSVCIPTYNGEKYLRETLNCVLAQTYKDFELLVVDDYSFDNTYEILLEYASKDNRIRIVRNEKNLGLVGNWNRCVELAYGDWIKFVFQDDIIAPDCIERLLESCKGGSLFAVCRRNIIFDKDAEPLKKYYKEYIENVTIEKIFHGKTVISPEMFKSACLEYMEGNFIGEPTAVMLHKSIFKKVGLFNTHLIQMCDIEFWIRVGIYEGFVYVPDNLATFRVHIDGTSYINRKKRISRMYFLDSIILYHEFAFNPLYKPLRDAAFMNIPQINFKDLLIYKVHEFVMMMESHSKDDASENFDFIPEWKEITRNFPALLKLPVKGYPRIIHAINRRLRVFYYKYSYNR